MGTNIISVLNLFRADFTQWGLWALDWINIISSQVGSGAHAQFTLWIYGHFSFSSVQWLSRVRLCNPMNRSMPGFPVHHQLPEFTQTHVHQVSDATQPSHPLVSPSPPAPSPSQHQSLFQWVNSSLEMAKVLEFQLQHQSLQRNPRVQNGLVGSPCSSMDSQESLG